MRTAIISLRMRDPSPELWLWPLDLTSEGTCILCCFLFLAGSLIKGKETKISGVVQVD